jgi:hypothetical protein
MSDRRFYEDLSREILGLDTEGSPTDNWERVKDPGRLDPNSQYVARVRVDADGVVYNDKGTPIGRVVDEYRESRHFVDASGKSWGTITRASNLYRWPDIPRPSWADEIAL